MSNDLISREALKKELNSRIFQGDYTTTLLLSSFNDLIDNAPTVEPEKVLIANVAFDEDKLKEIVQTEIIDKIKSGELVLKVERPQGEWKFIQGATTQGSLKCPFCDYRDYHKTNSNFCPNCGADMRKGGAE